VGGTCLNKDENKNIEHRLGDVFEGGVGVRGRRESVAGVLAVSCAGMKIAHGRGLGKGVY